MKHPITRENAEQLTVDKYLEMNKKMFNKIVKKLTDKELEEALDQLEVFDNKCEVIN